MSSFDEWFKRATGNDPFPYQRRFAEEGEIPQLVNIPTGCGKTAMAILGWLWRRRFDEREAIRKIRPRRLVYCLPMRVLVEQTVAEAEKWVCNLKQNYPVEMVEPLEIYTLMGGDVDNDWTLYPERDAILVGTQDMLLSRALNRGYATGRARWPFDFALLNNDSFWVMDEVQLQGPGVETSLQLDAFRQYRWGAFGPTATCWMSATVKKEDLITVDRKAIEENLGRTLLDRALSLEPEDEEALGKRLRAQKTIRMLGKEPTPEAIIKEHQAGQLTLVMFNTVNAARKFNGRLCNSVRLGKHHPKHNPSGIAKDRIRLLHSQFRPEDRKKIIDEVISFENNRRSGKDLGPGLILVSTQVVEAGVDISAARLWSEIAPWPSMVQRLGRLNRDGLSDDAQAYFWMPQTDKAEKKGNQIGPYLVADLTTAESYLRQLSTDARNGTNRFSEALKQFPIDRKPEAVIRGPDVYELFDNDPDLYGGFTDISRFVRAADREIKAYVLWRQFGRDNIQEQPEPQPKELCPVPFYEIRAFLEAPRDRLRQRGGAWLFQDDDDETWQSINSNAIRPGMTVLLHSKAGGYEEGWNPDSAREVEPKYVQREGNHLPHERDSRQSYWDWIATHTEKVCGAVQALSESLRDCLGDSRLVEALQQAARWHDRGKAHPKWQQALLRISTPPNGESGPWAKFVSNNPFRPNLRHECASALAARQEWLHNQVRGMTGLAVYLAAAHHGKVRMSLRSNLKPDGTPPEKGEERNAFGVFDGDVLRNTELGDGHTASETTLTLECMEMGDIETGRDDEPYHPSWTRMVLDLLGPCDPVQPTSPFRPVEPHNLGPFKLAYLEALLRAADARASRLELTL